MRMRGYKSFELDPSTNDFIFQNSMDSTIVPTDWRVANAMPLFKKEWDQISQPGIRRSENAGMNHYGGGNRAPRK